MLLQRNNTLQEIIAPLPLSSLASLEVTLTTPGILEELWILTNRRAGWPAMPVSCAEAQLSTFLYGVRVSVGKGTLGDARDAVCEVLS